VDETKKVGGIGLVAQFLSAIAGLLAGGALGGVVSYYAVLVFIPDAEIEEILIVMVSVVAGALLGLPVGGWAALRYQHDPRAGNAARLAAVFAVLGAVAIFLTVRGT